MRAGRSISKLRETSVSIRVMTWVIDSAPVQDSTQTLVLLCLADWADDSGLCWPSIDSVARRARCSESTARRAIRALENVRARDPRVRFDRPRRTGTPSSRRTRSW
ncbi:helix-turn-helix domain-containing protein [Rhodococcus sp. NPDC003318]|uniref:helix-turn-helix domain-containing protein n=1 Tax=Rhodococcus sp. NPDC003318 TaxID=3364503 RepID=UPI0036AA1484